MATAYESELTFFKFPIDQHETCTLVANLEIWNQFITKLQMARFKINASGPKTKLTFYASPWNCAYPLGWHQDRPLEVLCSCQVPGNMASFLSSSQILDSWYRLVNLNLFLMLPFLHSSDFPQQAIVEFFSLS